jgi:hypothetical protein
MLHPLFIAAGLTPLAAMLLATFAAFWLHEDERERGVETPRSRL